MIAEEPAKSPRHECTRPLVDTPRREGQLSDQENARPGEKREEAALPGVRDDARLFHEVILRQEESAP